MNQSGNYSVLIFGLLFFFSLSLSAGSPFSKKREVPTAKGVTDMVLLYHTHPSRPLWTPEQMRHYIYRPGDNGKPDWMFDGLLFVEFIAEKEGKTYTYDLNAYGRIYAGKELWVDLKNKTFAKGVGPDAAETVLEDLAKQGHYPPYKRQVVFGLPNPAYGVKDWGELNGKKLDFTNPQDRIAALNWYIDLVVAEWKKKDYKNLNLAGFYWTKELVKDNPDQDDVVLNKIKERLAAEGYEFSWIPYYGADGAAEWKEHGFDIAYQQPNHFFSTETPDWFLPESIKYAKSHGLNMEMEFDERVDQPEFAQRFYKYVDEFEKAGVWNDMPVAYYHGNDGWTLISESSKPELKAMHKRLGDLLSKRQGKFSRIIKK